MTAPRDETTTLRGLRFHFLDWGGDGPPLLLLHGGAQTAHSWDEVAADLATDYRVVALDQRGHGDSAWDPEGTYRRDDFVADVASFLDDRGLATATLVGLSMGGINALAFTAAHPARVRGLVVVDVAPTVEKTGREAIRKQLATFEFESFDEAVERAHAFNPRRSIENIRDRMHHGLRRLPSGKWTYKFDPRIGGGAEANVETLWSVLPGIRCPVMIVRGAESDILAKETATRFTRAIAGCETAEVAGAGHSVMGDNPAGFLAAVRPFLARHRL